MSRKGQPLIAQQFIAGKRAKQKSESRRDDRSNARQFITKNINQKIISIKNITLIIFDFVLFQKCQKLCLKIQLSVMFCLIIDVINRPFDIADAD